MNEFYNDLQPMNSNDVNPPSSLTFQEKLDWIDMRIEAAERYKGVLTDDYYKKSKGHLVDQLKAVKEQLEISNIIPMKIPTTKSSSKI